ncbi:glycosyltransferase family 4 protein [Methylobacterium sp. JK268]
MADRAMQDARPRTAPDRLRVVVVTPLGQGGRGGIDRQMDEMRSALRLPQFAHVEAVFMTTRGQGSHAASPLLIARLLAGLARRRFVGGIDAVHINLSQRGSTYRKLIVSGFCRLLGLPYVLHLHGSRYRQFWDGAPAPLSRAITGMFAGSAAVLVLGSVWRDYIAGRVPSVPTVILPSSTRDPGVADRPEGRPLHILFAGRLGERKGVLDLAAALARLPQRNWRATLAGDGEVERTRRAVEALGLADRVAVPGWVSGTTYEELLADSDIVVLPSYDENLPLSVVEAFARGRPVVCTPVGAIPDIVEDGQTGLLVAPGDVEGLAAALDGLLCDEALRRRLGAGARRVFEDRLELTRYAATLVETWRRAAAMARR